MPYMIGGEPAVLADLARALGGDAEVTVRRIVGPPERPTLIAVDMPAARAEALQKQHGSRLTIEPDLPVELF
ncbi:hypothetical protein [Nonomuraea turcica]|uniref:hypothetical protein n=1 Tax=Nonomuraea sp. G32 TaxID=3067274 RepID=UPI00273A89E0|nr:hypothetical protein [Nonomuraea sp. G32]MDP4504127.1 hypothetical protein [Nonomuraea sp. G32]